MFKSCSNIVLMYYLKYIYFLYLSKQRTCTYKLNYKLFCRPWHLIKNPSEKIPPQAQFCLWTHRRAQPITPSSPTWWRPTTKCTAARAASWRVWQNWCSPALRCCWGPSVCHCWTDSSICSKCHRPTPSKYSRQPDANSEFLMFKLLCASTGVHHLL